MAEQGGFEKLFSRVISLPMTNVDTDQIIPAKFLKTTTRSGLGKGLFWTWRKDPQFVLNRPEATGAEILLAGHNFGCGSSREHAVWALMDSGFKAVLSSGFSDIFRNNAFKNGLLAAEIDQPVAAELRAQIERDPGSEILLDLEATLLVLPDGREASFRVDPFAQSCLLRGVDQLGYLGSHLPAIEVFEKAHECWIETTSAKHSEETDPAAS